jgi:hypothetical protein
MMMRWSRRIRSYDVESMRPDGQSREIRVVWTRFLPLAQGCSPIVCQAFYLCSSIATTGRYVGRASGPPTSTAIEGPSVS